MNYLPLPEFRRMIIYPDKSQIISRYLVIPDTEYVFTLPKTTMASSLRVFTDLGEQIGYHQTIGSATTVIKDKKEYHGRIYHEDSYVIIDDNNIAIKVRNPDVIISNSDISISVITMSNNVLTISYILTGIIWKSYLTGFLSRDMHIVDLSLSAEIINEIDSIMVVDMISLNPYKTDMFCVTDTPSCLSNLERTPERQIMYDLGPMSVIPGNTIFHIQTVRDIKVRPVNLVKSTEIKVYLASIMKTPFFIPYGIFRLYTQEGYLLGELMIPRHFKDEDLYMIYGISGNISFKAQISKTPPIENGNGIYSNTIAMYLKNKQEDPVTVKVLHHLENTEFISSSCVNTSLMGNVAIFNIDLVGKEDTVISCVLQLRL